ncbi:hypothetical protein SKAU_G00129700 [Synaphobranchus kaupii]|uniref:Uncharacterized protein n=1 Tax=Synaphobranchus kaupii TaxID=118154 RepID=A0A9Q1FQK1_SYNKA|nr:hypothetical protein SKAU_G00129700 [Synaphobranchus kaupii]
MAKSKQCDGRKKEKSQSKSFKLEDREACCQEDDQEKTIKTKKRKPCTETEEAPGPVPVLKARKRPSESTEGFQVSVQCFLSAQAECRA